MERLCLTGPALQTGSGVGAVVEDLMDSSIARVGTARGNAAAFERAWSPHGLRLVDQGGGGDCLYRVTAAATLEGLGAEGHERVRTCVSDLFVWEQCDRHDQYAIPTRWLCENDDVK